MQTLSSRLLSKLTNINGFYVRLFNNVLLFWQEVFNLCAAHAAVNVFALSFY